ncbi:hypothetical protein COOONC_11272, partial [Cooperia oncophora]
MMYAAIVEYSLIAAAVMYIVWKNIGRVHYSSEYVKRKYHIRMDCSNTTTAHVDKSDNHEAKDQ